MLRRAKLALPANEASAPAHQAQDPIATAHEAKQRRQEEVIKANFEAAFQLLVARPDRTTILGDELEAEAACEAGSNGDSPSPGATAANPLASLLGYSDDSSEGADSDSEDNTANAGATGHELAEESGQPVKQETQAVKDGAVAAASAAAGPVCSDGGNDQGAAAAAASVVAAAGEDGVEAEAVLAAAPDMDSQLASFMAELESSGLLADDQAQLEQGPERDQDQQQQQQQQQAQQQAQEGAQEGAAEEDKRESENQAQQSAVQQTEQQEQHQQQQGQPGHGQQLGQEQAVLEQQQQAAAKPQQGSGEELEEGELPEEEEEEVGADGDASAGGAATEASIDASTATTAPADIAAAPAEPAEQRTLGLLAAAPEWAKVLDTGSGRIYFWNMSSNEVVWEPPLGTDGEQLLPPPGGPSGAAEASTSKAQGEAGAAASAAAGVPAGGHDAAAAQPDESVGHVFEALLAELRAPTAARVAALPAAVRLAVQAEAAHVQWRRFAALQRRALAAAEAAAAGDAATATAAAAGPRGESGAGLMSWAVYEAAMMHELHTMMGQLQPALQQLAEVESKAAQAAAIIAGIQGAGPAGGHGGGSSSGSGVMGATDNSGAAAAAARASARSAAAASSSEGDNVHYASTSLLPSWAQPHQAYDFAAYHTQQPPSLQQGAVTGPAAAAYAPPLPPDSPPPLPGEAPPPLPGEDPASSLGRKRPKGYAAPAVSAVSLSAAGPGDGDSSGEDGSAAALGARKRRRADASSSGAGGGAAGSAAAGVPGIGLKGVGVKKGGKASALLSKWSAVRRDLQEEERQRERAEEEAFDPALQEAKRVAEIQAWRREQLSDGAAEANPNFAPLQGDWRSKLLGGGGSAGGGSGAAGAEGGAAAPAAKKVKQSKAGKASSSSSKGAKKASSAATAGAAPAKASAPAASAAAKPDLAKMSRGLPPGWVAMWDKESGDVYYGNPITKETSWDRPS